MRPPVSIWAFPLALAAALSGCAGRPPALVPPPSGVVAVEGFASGSIAGVDAVLKGKFAFLFRKPGLGRIEGVDPIGRTAFLIIFQGQRAWFVLPGKKVYAEEGAAVMMERFLGLTLLPDETIGLLAGRWEEIGAQTGWRLEQDGLGRIARGEREGFSFEVRRFFPGDSVPREIEIAGPGTSGRVKVLELGFNPAPREAAFDVSFLGAYALKTWDGIREVLDR